MQPFIAEILRINPNYNAELLEKAYLKADELQRNQKRKSGEPYIIHPIAVVKILAELGMDDSTLAAGMLHDTVEDTGYTTEDLEKDFGPEIAMLVDGVTKLTNIQYTTKEDEQAENMRKMFLAMSKDIRVLVIKLSDRLHNLRTINYMTPAKIQEKCQETVEIYAPLAARLGMYAFKFEMEDIAFRNLHPEEYQKLDNEMNARSYQREEDIEHVIDEIRILLDNSGIKYDIYGRNKHYYSIYKKMIFQHKQLDEIFDLRAVRVIVDSVRDCYAVLGAVHTRWTPIPGRFKDYVAMPKPNGYQSLHTTVLGDNGEPFEIQIRTWEMHRIAEYGIAAHWKYKEGIKSDDEEARLAWIRQSLEWQQDARSSKEFLETVKMDLFSNQVFVFTPKGDVIELPAGSTPLDFAYKIHSAIGEKCVGAKVNGKMVPIDYQLQNGEIVDIVTSTNSKGPSIDWLKIVKTNSAKNKIRQYLRKASRSDTAERGKHLLEQTARRKNWDLQSMLKNSYLMKAAKAQGFTQLEDLYNSISYGGAPLNRTMALCESYYHEEKQLEAERIESENRTRVSNKKKIEKTTGVSVKGVSALLIRYAHCCNPVPGDEIIGYTTKGRGISIHRKDCINMISLPASEQARLINVEWENVVDSMTFDASMKIVAENRKGMLADISKICEDNDIDISALNTKTDKTGVATIDITLSVNGAKEIGKMMSRFKQVSGVYDVYRSNNA
jgi:GTP pyrophosphokinase